MTAPIGQGVPSARTPTSADPRMPVPYWIAPISADTGARAFRKAAERAGNRVGDNEPCCRDEKKSGITEAGKSAPARP